MKDVLEKEKDILVIIEEIELERGNKVGYCYIWYINKVIGMDVLLIFIIIFLLGIVFFYRRSN